MLLQTPAFEGRLSQGSAPLGATPIHLAIPRSREGAAALLTAFNAEVERLHKDGWVDAIVAREMARAADIARTLQSPI